MSRQDDSFIAFLQMLALVVFVVGTAFIAATCDRHDRANCHAIMAVTHSLRDSLVIADVSSTACSEMLKDSLVARAKRQP